MPNMTAGTRMAWYLAMIETYRANYKEITPELLLCGITKLEDTEDPELLDQIGLPKPLQESYLQEISTFLSIFQKSNIAPRPIRHKLRNVIGDGGFKRDDKTDLQVHRSTETKIIFDAALQATEMDKKESVSLSDLLVALLAYENKNINDALAEQGIDTMQFTSALQQIRLPTNETLSPDDARRLIRESDEDDDPEVTISIQHPKGKTKSIKLKQKEIIIGRRGGDKPVDVDLSLDPSVSRQHAKLYYQRNCWYIADLNSRYGTVVDGEKLSDACQISSKSRIQVGDSQISISYETFATQLNAEQSPQDAGIITNAEKVSELAPPGSITEDERIEVLAEITAIATNTRTPGELFEGCIEKIFTAIPRAERATILIGQGNELFPVKYIPRQQAYYSSTLVNKARDDKVAFCWVSENDSAKPGSMFNAVAAIYAPMIRGGQVVGVLHVDSKSLVEGFSKKELDTLSVIANTITLALPPSVGEQDTPSVFISYAHKDKKRVSKIKEDLRRNGISVWIDERLKLANEAWQKQLALAIEKQKFFLFVMTPDSVASPYCDWELNTAISLGKPIIPIMMKKARVPVVINAEQYLDMRRDSNKALSVLVQRLQEP